MAQARIPATQLKRPVHRILLPLQEFVALESSSGKVLLAGTLAALAWANSPWSESYFALWQTPVRVGVGPLFVEEPLVRWINDGLMALFFLVVGLEIKRELLVGELASRRRAAAPVAAALGGMAAPALLFLAVAGDSGRAWSIPMATDIAFALGVLTLLGDRVPIGLKVFLAALAITDDLGSILLIAFGFSGPLHLGALGTAAGLFAVLLLSSRLGVRSVTWYCLVGVGLWLAFLESGVHATVSGVALALAVPAWSRLHAERFREGAEHLLADIRAHDGPGFTMLGNEKVLSIAHALEKECKRVQPPLHRLERALVPWVSMGIMPLFALANAGLDVRHAAAGAGAVSLGVAVGLLVGKPVGIVGGTWLAVRLGLARRPSGVRWPHLWGAGLLGGIGFTMSLFLAGLSVQGPGLGSAKLAILSASTLAGLLGMLVLWRTLPRRETTR